MNKPIRSEKNASAKGAVKQASTQPASAPAHRPKQWTQLYDTKHWQLLVSGCETTEESLWAAPDGRLYIVDEDADKVRKVDLPSATVWFCDHHSNDPYLADPFYPEGSAANLFCQMVRLMIASGQSAKPVPAAAVATPLPAPQPEMIVPAHIAIAMVDALGRLQLKANEAGALALMIADQSGAACKIFGGWEPFDGMDFTDGSQGLARSISAQLDREVAALRKHSEPAMERLRGRDGEMPFVRMEYEAEKALLRATGCELAVRADSLEEAVLAMESLLRLSALVHDRRGGNIAFAADAARAELAQAFGAACEAYGQLRVGLLTVAQQRQSEQRQAA